MPVFISSALTMTLKAAVTVLVLVFMMCDSSMARNSSALYIINDPIVFESTNENCPSQDAIQSKLDIAKSNISEAVRTVINPHLNNKYGSACGGPGWTRMAYLNMSDINVQCPSNWRLLTTVRGCGISRTSSTNCDSTSFRNTGLSYSRVCGRVVAYQRSQPNAFYSYNRGGRTSIESAYADGVLLTHGPVGSRKHIWTFTGALFKQSTTYSTSHRVHVCPCTTSAISWPYQIPPFVGNNYFCDSGNPGPSWDTTLYTDDPLWDGAGCPSTSSCCQFNNPPWFDTRLPATTTDNIEVRLCSVNQHQDVIVSLIEVYVA